MEKNFLINNILDIQKEYLEMLERIKDKINTSDYMYIIDEINIFWYSKKDIIRLYLSNITIKDNAYVFTGASYLDINDFEHYPFVMMGNIHIVDDPLCKYSLITPKCKSDEFFQQLKKQIIDSVEDNISILSQYKSNILILPLHLLSDDDTKFINKSAMKIFLNLFSIEDIDINTYKNFNSIEEISDALRTDIKEYIVFDEDDDFNKSLIERFRVCVNKINLPMEKENDTDAFKFFILVYGFIAQALDIILCCMKFNLIPYLRYKVTFQYVLLLSESLYNNSEFNNIMFKCKIAHVLYNIFDKERFSEIIFDKFYNRLREYEFDVNVERDLKDSNTNLNNVGINKIIDVLNKNIDNCFLNNMN